jgi:hypothetical protein
MAMTQLDELRITIDDALGLARRIPVASETTEVSLVIVKLEEAGTHRASEGVAPQWRLVGCARRAA